MLTPKEQHYIREMERRLDEMRSFLTERSLPASEDAAGWYEYLAALKDIQGNANNDVSFAATLMAKTYFYVKFQVVRFDAAEKPQGAPGLDVECQLPDGRRLVAEIKTTAPYRSNDLGAQQKAAFDKDFSKLASAKADLKVFFLTERRTFDFMRRPKYRCKLTGVTVVLLPQGEEIVA